MGLGTILRRSLVYVGLAVASLLVITLLVAASIRTGIPFTSGWVGLIAWTPFIFWLVIRSTDSYWKRSSYWLTVGSILTMHMIAFVAILRRYPDWRLLWFAPIALAEVVLFGAILDAFFSPRKRFSRR